MNPQIQNPFEILEKKISNIETMVSEMLQKQTENIPPPPDLETPKNLYSLQALADYLSCSIVTAQRLKNSGKIPFRQFGRKVIFNTQSIMDALKKKGGKA